MAVVRWKFYDSTVPETWTFTYNPISGGSINRKKNITSTATTAPGGNIVLFEGAQDPLETEIKGFVLDKTHFDELVKWYKKDVPVQMTDDLGRTFEVYITEFNPSRERAVHSPWKHSFSMKMIVLQELVV